MLIMHFESSADEISSNIRFHLNRALLTGEGCKTECKKRAAEIATIIEEIISKHNETSINVNDFLIDSSNTSARTFEESRNRFRNFEYLPDKRPTRQPGTECRR